MIKLNIIKNGEVTNSAQFQTQDGLNIWLAFQESNSSFGKPGEYVVEQIDISNDVKLAKIRELRVPLLERADVLINIAQDKNASDLADLRNYRQALRDVTDSFKADMSLLDSVDPESFIFPSKPS